MPMPNMHKRTYTTLRHNATVSENSCLLRVYCFSATFCLMEPDDSGGYIIVMDITEEDEIVAKLAGTYVGPARYDTFSVELARAFMRMSNKVPV